MSITGYNPATITSAYCRHVALTISGNTHSLYLDGSMVAQNLSSGNVFASYSDILKLYIGCAGDLTYGFTGIIDDFKIWNRALPTTDISAVYNANRPGPINFLSADAKSAMLGSSSIFIGSIYLTTLTVTAITSGKISLYSSIYGTGITGGTQITAFNTGSGGIGTYTVSVEHTPIVTSRSITGKQAAGAYGVRLLNSEYKGPVMQIKAGTEGTPTDFYANTFGKLGTEYLGNGTSLSTFVGVATPTYITIWYDQTGNGNHGTTTSSSMPTYNATANAVSFSTAGSYFDISNNAFPIENSKYTYIFTPKDNPSGTNKNIFYGGIIETNNYKLYQVVLDLTGEGQFFNGFYGPHMKKTTSPFTYGTKVATVYNGTYIYNTSSGTTGTDYTKSGATLYFNNILQTTNMSYQNGQRTQASGPNVLGGKIPAGSSGINPYNGTLQFFYWAPIDLSLNDITILCNT